MRILVVGGSGLLGRELLKVLSRAHEVGGTYYTQPYENCRPLDISDRSAIRHFVELHYPDVVIHTAAIKNADLCEENRELAWKTNVEGTKNLVEVCKKYGIKFVYISSDYVFDGGNGPYSELSKPSPSNFYGITKLEGERIVKEELIDYIIIRPTILYGYGDRDTFVSQVRKRIAGGEILEADNRIEKYPLLTSDVAILIQKLLERDETGVFHIAGKDRVTRYEWASRIAATFELDGNRIKPIKEQYKAPKPYDVRLISLKTRELDSDITGLDEALRRIKMQEGCTFRLFYLGHPIESALGRNIALFRMEAGRLLARESGSDADMVVPIPETGIFYAIGFSEASGLPLRFGLVREQYAKKTLFEPWYEKRAQAVRKKLMVISHVVSGKRIALIDEAILSGITLKTAVDKLKEYGAKEIHVRVAAPPIFHRCPAGEQPSSINLLTLAMNGQATEDELCQYFAVDSLKFLRLETLAENLLTKVPVKCLYCFDGNIA
jgi:dTDP-4-dehydrorhamnose reductase